MVLSQDQAKQFIQEIEKSHETKCNLGHNFSVFEHNMFNGLHEFYDTIASKDTQIKTLQEQNNTLTKLLKDIHDDLDQARGWELEEVVSDIKRTIKALQEVTNGT